MNLYQIDNEIMECIDFETGEIIDEQRLEALQMEREQKIKNVGLWIKNLRSDAEALKAEKDAFAEREKKVKSKIESLERYLQNALQGAEYKDTQLTITYRKSESLEVRDISKVPEDYLRIAEPTVDKMALKKFIKAGNEVEGCELVTSMNMQIK